MWRFFMSKSILLFLIFVLISISLCADFEEIETGATNLGILTFTELILLDYELLSSGSDYIIVEIDGLFYIIYL